jgi:hypothetical protein
VQAGQAVSPVFHQNMDPKEEFPVIFPPVLEVRDDKARDRVI